MKKLVLIPFFFFLFFLFYSCQQNNSCDDVDCSNQGICKVIDSEATCACHDGYVAEGLTCVLDTPFCDMCRDWENCAENTCIPKEGRCNSDADCQSENLHCNKSLHLCENIIRSCENVDCGSQGSCVINSDFIAECNCHDGFVPKDLNCIKDPCEEFDCGEGGTCSSNGETVVCTCEEGFLLKDGICLKDFCHDVDCGEGGTCVSNVIDYTCTCEAGSIFNGTTCIKPQCVIENLDNQQGPFEAQVGSSENPECKTSTNFCSNIQLKGRVITDSYQDFTYTWNVEHTAQSYNIQSWLTKISSDQIDLFIPYLSESPYTVSLTTTNGTETYTCNTQVYPKTDKKLYIELTWDKNSDVDLHLLRPSQQNLDVFALNPESTELIPELEAWRKLTNAEWFDNVSKRDCHFANCKNQGIEWGNINTPLDNPILTRDDVVEKGPEIIIIENPEEGWYRLATHLYRLNEEAQSVTPKIKVFCNSELKYESAKTLEKTDYFWLNTNIYWEKDEEGNATCHLFNEDRIFTKRQGRGIEDYQGYMVNDDCEPGYDGINCLSCDMGYHPVENTCIENQTCDENTCIEPNKNVCNDSTYVTICSCNDGYHENEAGDCVLTPLCQEDSCPEETKSVCSTETGSIECLCINGFNENTEGHCEPCGFDILEPNNFQHDLTTFISNGIYNLSICPEKSDSISFYAEAGSTVTTTTYYSYAETNQRMYTNLYSRQQGTRIAYADLSHGENTLSYTITEAGEYTLQIFAPHLQTANMNYTLELSGASLYRQCDSAGSCNCIEGYHLDENNQCVEN